ncbi:MAG: VWA domain-containing protein [Pyrinomonadaceae bacterium]|nr:VWA domain-containing protein [Pyrinomonadaceae bacterium]
MKLNRVISLFCAGLFLLISSEAALSQGIIIPRPCPRPRCRPIPRPIPLPNVLPVKSIQINTKIKGQVATTRIVQVFRNNSRATLEGTYFFPIPDTASIEQFAIWENGKKLVGEVRSREEARRIYNSIVRKKKDPGLLEYAGKNLFQASIFPIPGNSDKKLELTYSQVLKAESGTVAYRYPLGTGKNLWARRRPHRIRNVRYAQKPTQQKFGVVSGKVEIIGKEALRNIYSPSHKVEVNRKGEKGATISFETKGDPNDFQLFYGLSNNDFGMSLMTYREPGKDGYFLMMLSPKDKITDRELVNKDIVFVLDTSGSMADEGKMEKARKALLFGINGLRSGDRFNVINFAGEEHLMESGLVSANSSGKKTAAAFVKKLRPNGGTNINDALRAGLKQFDSSDRPKMLVFLTDGLPTVGESNIDRIIKNAKDIKVNGLRLFPFGVGYDVNTRLLDKLAAENSGLADYIEPKEDLEIKVSSFFTKVNSPVLTNLAMDFGILKTDLLYPRKMTDIFKGTQLTLIGRYRNSGDVKNAVFKLTGKTGSDTRTFRYANLDFPKRTVENEFLPRLWATRRVGWLVEQIRTNGANKELKDEIVALGTRYGIVTPYTSYLATDGSERRDVSGNFVTTLPRNGRRANRAARPVPRATPMSATGSSAVKESKKAREQQAAVDVFADDELIRLSVDKDGVQTVKKVGVKTFYLQDGVWVDSVYEKAADLREVKLKFASNEYFDLINKEKALAKYFAIGEKIVVVWNRRVYHVID